MLRNILELLCIVFFMTGKRDELFSYKEALVSSTECAVLFTSGCCLYVVKIRCFIDE